MSYCVTKEHSNGYRCGCCVSYWTDTEWYDDLEEALEEVPTTHCGNSDYELTEVEVKDGVSGEVIAWGRVSWSQGYWQYSGYDYTRWRGHRPDTGDFEHITGKGDVEGKTWDELMRGMAETKAKREMEAAQRKLEAAQKEMDKLTRG